MDAQTFVRAKAALEALNRAGSMTGEALLNYVGVAVCQPITTLDGQLLLKLIAHVDAVVENFRPGTLEKWGLSYDTMKAHNPNLILLRISGFGQTGPYRERAGYDRVFIHNAQIFPGIQTLQQIVLIPTPTLPDSYAQTQEFDIPSQAQDL